MKGSTIFGPTFTLPFSDTDLIADIQNYLGYLRARIAATYTLVMREKRDIARMQSQEHFLQSDDDTGSEAETEPETEQTFVEKRMPLRSFLEIDSGILDEVCEVMVTEVAYEVEYSMADAFIILPLMNIIHEVAVDGLMEMTPDPEQLHKELLAGSYGLHDELYAEQMAILAAQQAEEARLAEEERERLEHEARRRQQLQKRIA